MRKTLTIHGKFPSSRLVTANRVAAVGSRAIRTKLASELPISRLNAVYAAVLRTGGPLLRTLRGLCGPHLGLSLPNSAEGQTPYEFLTVQLLLHYLYGLTFGL